MKRFITYALLFIVAICAGLGIVTDPGYAYFSYRHWSLEMPLWLALLLSFFSLLFVIVITSLYKNLSSASHHLKQRLYQRKHDQSAAKTIQGFIAFGQGQWQQAEIKLVNAAEYALAPFSHYIHAAKSSFSLGHEQRGDRYLEQAKKDQPAAKVAIDLVKLDHLVQENRWQEAADFLQTIPLSCPQALRFCKIICSHTQDWKTLEDNLASFRKYPALSNADTATLEITVYSKKLERQNDLETLENTWKQLARHFRTHPALVAAYAKKLIELHERDAAETTLRQGIKKQWDTTLVNVYGKTLSSTPEKQLRHAEKWLKQHPDDSDLLLTLGRLCQNLELWGQAKEYFQRSLTICPLKETYLALGDLFESQHNLNEALKCYRLGALQK